MGKLIVDTLNKEDIISSMDMLYGLSKDKYCHREEFEALNQKFEILQKEYDTLRNEKEELLKNVSKMQIDIEKAKEENAKLTEEKSKIEQDCKGYKNRLDEAGITNADSAEKTYYQVVNKHLERTTNNKAPYIVIKDEFFFNENGQHQKAIQCREEYLEPFCEVISSAPDANYIKMINKGKCKIQNSDQMEVEEKAKINLIRR